MQDVKIVNRLLPFEGISVCIGQSYQSYTIDYKEDGSADVSWRHVRRHVRKEMRW